MIVSHRLNQSKITSAGENLSISVCCLVCCPCLPYNKEFPFLSARKISMQEVLLQQQEVGSTDMYH